MPSDRWNPEGALELREFRRSVIPGRASPAASNGAPQLLPGVAAATASIYSGIPGLSAMVIPTLQFQSRRTSALGATKTNPMLFGPLWRIAFRMGSIPIKVFPINPETGGRKDDLTHPAYTLLRRPNPVLTRNLLIAGTVLGLLQTGAVGWYKQRIAPAQGAPVALWPIPAASLYAVRDPQTLISSYKLRVTGYAEQTLRFEDVCYFRLMPDTFDWAAGLSPIQSLGEVADYAQAGLESATDYFDKAILQRVYLNTHGKQLDPQARTRLRMEMELSRRDRYAIPIIEDNATLDEMGDPPSPDVLSSSLATALGLIEKTLSLPGDLTDQQTFYSDVVYPIADAIEQELERSYMPEYTPDAFAEFQFRELLAGTPEARAKLHQTKILSGQETPNEGREAENMAPLPGGDRLFMPMNEWPIETLGSMQQEAGGGGGLDPMLPGGGTSVSKGSSGGNGGEQGQQTVSPVPKTGSRVAARSVMIDMQATRWGPLRGRIIDSQAEALSRRIRSVLKTELKSLRSSLSSGLTYPDSPEFESTIWAHDSQLLQLVSSFMRQAASGAWDAAGEDFLGLEHEDMSDSVTQQINVRAGEVADRFSAHRLGVLHRLSESGQLSTIAASWDAISGGITEAVARTEVSWAFEEGALARWGEQGFSEFNFMREGTSCTTGVCDDAPEKFHQGRHFSSVGGSFDGAVHAPLHHRCECFATPHVAA